MIVICYINPNTVYTVTATGCTNRVVRVLMSKLKGLDAEGLRLSTALASGQLSTAGGRHKGQNMLWLLGLLNMCVGCLFPARI